MRRPEEVERVRSLAVGGLNHCQIARLTGIPRGTVRDWVNGKTRVARVGGCPECGHPEHDFEALPTAAYAYLLGIYLGDGTISRGSKGVWKLRIFQDTRYPEIIGEIVRATRAVMPANRVAVTRKGTEKCVEISSHSKSWPCLLPQAGPGRKHERKIELIDWQWPIVRREPGMFVRGLIHSDGCRVSNKVWHGKYAYPRYFFTNRSLDIQELFKDVCALIGVECRNNNRWTISVARRASVARLDEFVGPKR
jgi:hypothetical protein